MSEPGAGAPQIGLCIDLDAVLVSTPLMLMVASAVDLVEEIGVLTRATESGELPFDRSLRLRCRILEDVPVSEARRRAAVATLDPDVSALVLSAADHCQLVTSLPACWLTDLAARLGTDVIASESLVESDRLVALTEIVDKAAVVHQIRSRCDSVVAVGAGANDLAMLEAADVRVAFGARPPRAVRELADYWVTSGRALWQLLRRL